MEIPTALPRNRWYSILSLPSSGVTTMGSDRANPGAPNHNGPNGGPQAQAVEQKHWPGPLICHNVVFWPSEFCKISPQSLGNGISETLDSKIFRMSKPWTPRKLVHIRRSTRAFGTSTRGAFENFEPGAPWYNVTPLPSTYALIDNPEDKCLLVVLDCLCWHRPFE
jgi:hypothetical protein